MVSLLAPALLALLAGPSACSDPHSTKDTPADVDYSVRLEVDPEARAVYGRARLEGIPGSAETALRFRFSHSYAFKTLEPRLADDIKFSSDGSALKVKRPDPFIWELEDTPIGRGVVDLEWTVKIDHREHPEVIAAVDGYEQPYLSEEFGMLFTAALIPIPEIGGEQDLEPRVTISVEAPEHWDVVAPWEAKAGEVRTFAPDLDGLRNDVLLLGDWRVSEVQAGELAAKFAFAPGEEWLEPLVEKQLGNIVASEIELFGGAPQAKYLFVFGPSDGVQGYGGSPKQNSMTLFISQALPRESLERDVSHLVAHEFHHTWMKARCRPHGELRFVIEGFTDYFAYVVSWRLGHLSDDAFKSVLEDKIGGGARALESYGRSLADAGGPEFFLGRAAYDACYRSGLTLALWTDLALRREEAPRNLDEFLRAFYNDPAWVDGTRPTLEAWGVQLESWLGPTLAEAQLKAVRDSNGFDVLELFEAIGTSIESTSRAAGTTPRANFDGVTVRVVDPAGPAGLAGLQARDRLVSVNGQRVDNESDVRKAWPKTVDGNLVLVFERDGAEQTIDVLVPTVTEFELPPSVLDILAK